MSEAVLAVTHTAKAVGFAWRCGDTFMSGEFEDWYEAMCAVEELLQNGFRWTVLCAHTSPLHLCLAFLCSKYGATDYVTNDPMLHITDPQLRKAAMWRRGLIAANHAARLLYEENE